MCNCLETTEYTTIPGLLLPVIASVNTPIHCSSIIINNVTGIYYLVCQQTSTTIILQLNTMPHNKSKNRKIVIKY